ncbi:MAG: Hpt domain-containing protein [candidate division WOR-3 bacterium]
MNETEKIIIKVDPEIKDLIPGFLQNRQRDINNIESLLKEENFEEIERIGHSMKGSGGGYGFTGISEIGRFIEMAAKEKDIQKIKKGIEDLKDYLNRIELVE